MSQIPETGLGRRLQGSLRGRPWEIGMSQIPETGLGRTAGRFVTVTPNHPIGMSQIPETGLGLKQPRDFVHPHRNNRNEPDTGNGIGTSPGRGLRVDTAPSE